MRALSAHPYGCGCVEGLSCKMRVPRHPRASTALAPAQLSPTSLWGSVRSSSLFSEGEGVITQTVTWVASGAPAKGRTSFWQGPTALWDEEHARQSHQASVLVGNLRSLPPDSCYTIPRARTGAKSRSFPSLCPNSPTTASQAPAHWKPRATTCGHHLNTAKF